MLSAPKTFQTAIVNIFKELFDKPCTLILLLLLVFQGVFDF